MAASEEIGLLSINLDLDMINEGVEDILAIQYMIRAGLEGASHMFLVSRLW